MKLAIVCRPWSFHGGVETATAGLVGELLRRGHGLDLISTGAQPDVPGARVRRLRVPGQPSALRLLAFAMAARQAVRTRGYDIVQSHERGLEQDVYRAGEGTHAGYLDAMGRAPRGLYHRLALAIERRIFTLASTRHVVAISRRDAVEIARRYGTPADRLSVVYNGVDLERFHPDRRARRRGAVRAALGLPDQAWIALFVGSGFERKGLAPLIEAFARLGDRHARLVVAGKGDSGPYRRQAEALRVADRVAWLGARRDVDDLYAIADAVALPTRYEPFGNVHLEALASGVPVLASGRAGGAEVVVDGQCGAVVPEPDASGVAAGLEAIRALDPARAAMAARAAAEPFTYGAQVDALGRIHRRLHRERVG